MTQAEPSTGQGSGKLLGPLEVRELAERLDVTPTKKLGQNFVIDPNTVRKIVRLAGVEAGDRVVEVGPGLGSLTLGLTEVGASVTAIEIAPVAIEKARRLAAGRQVAVDFILADMLASDWPPAELQENFDWVIGIFIQFVGPAERERQFSVMKQLTRPGGRILLHGYTPKQLDYKTGGPSVIENLYTPELLRAAFAGWEIEEIVEYEDDISEGLGHKGRSALIGLIAHKPA